MNRLARLICVTGLLILAAPGSLAFPQTPPLRRAGDVPAKGLVAWLESQGYEPTPLSLNKGGWLDVKVEVEGLQMLLMLDTGANNLNLHRPSAERAKLPIRPIEQKTAALGGILETGTTKISQLSIGNVTSPAESYVVDFGPTNALRARYGEPPCDGVIGGSYLAYWSAIIDYANSTLYLLDPDRKPKSPERLLVAAGYVPISLELNKSLTLDVKAEANGKLMVLFLDTGAREALSLDRSSAKRAGLVVKENENQSVELGGALVTGWANVENLAVGRFAVSTRAHVTDYTPTNASRKGLAVGPCDGTLNGGLLVEHSAIIDYAHRKLFLLKAGED